MSVPETGAMVGPAAQVEIEAGNEAEGIGLGFSETHMDIVQAFVKLQQSSQTRASRRGWAQQPLRELEQRVRSRTVDLAEQLAQTGYRQEEIARRLGIHERTLRQWDYDGRLGSPLVVPLGRPLARSEPGQQQAVFSWLTEIGPGVGVPTLRNRFELMARAELEEILKFYRRLWRDQNRRLVHVLHWQEPGTVWAMDFAQAPCPIGGLCPYLLAVRDLASGQQLLWLPVAEQTARVAQEALDMLFTIHGPPLVLKSDNGSAFIADELRRCLQGWEVFPLFSPPHTPAYNGSIEAAIGSLKTRTQRQADRAGHAEAWTSQGVEAARREANSTARPRRLQGRTPEEVWACRRLLTAADRQSFQATVERFREEARQARALPLAGDLTRTQQAAVDRIAIRRALVAHDLLLFTRRRILVPIKRPKVTLEG